MGGPNEAINIVPLDRDLNRKISHFESGIKENCVGDFSLNYHVHLRYPDEFSFRPCRLSYYAYLESNNTKFVLSLDVSQ